MVVPLPAPEAPGTGQMAAAASPKDVLPSRPAVQPAAKQLPSLFDRSQSAHGSTRRAATLAPSDVEDEDGEQWGFGSHLFGTSATAAPHGVQPRHLQRHPSTASSAGRDELVQSLFGEPRRHGLEATSTRGLKGGPKGAGKGQAIQWSGDDAGHGGSEWGDLDGKQTSEDEEDLRLCQKSLQQVQKLLGDENAVGSPAAVVTLFAFLQIACLGAWRYAST